MDIGKRDFIVLAGAAALATVLPDSASSKGQQKMYGLIGKMTTVAGKRDELLSILLEGVAEMPGCLSYVVAKDPADANAIWITEVWDSEQSHKASLSLPAVKQAITRGKPMIAGFSNSTVTEPVGGHGLAPAKTR
jgi:quinol monooxygenase YgiN